MERPRHSQLVKSNKNKQTSKFNENNKLSNIKKTFIIKVLFSTKDKNDVRKRVKIIT